MPAPGEHAGVGRPAELCRQQTPLCFRNTTPRGEHWSPALAWQPHCGVRGDQMAPACWWSALVWKWGYSHPPATAGAAAVGKPSLQSAEVMNASKKTTSDTGTLQL